MQKITKAVIPCGGAGTRFLPITKAVPKEILPVVDTPVLGHIVSEAIDSGITDIMIVLGKGKEVIREYFTPNPKLERRLRENGKHELADLLAKIGHGAHISFAVQERPQGSGDALLYAEEFTAGEPFALAWGDDLIYAGENPVMGQLIGVYEKYGASVLGVQTIDTDEIYKYGVADTGGKAAEPDGRTYRCHGIAEKPQRGEPLKSRLAALGRYVLTSEVFDVLRKTATDVKSGELQLTDALNSMARDGKVYAYDFIGKRYDMGDKFGSVCAVVDHAARDKVFGEAFKAFLKEYVKEL